MKEQNIVVALRVRQINSREVRAGAKPIARTVDENLVVLMDPNRDSEDILRAKRSHDHHYMFDVAFGTRTTQKEVYRQTSQGLVHKVISGYNATVFAYGATGAGKTYTMLGEAGEPGIMALTLNDLFTLMEERREDNLYNVTMAYLEIYNETIRDLLGPSSAGILDLREDARGATTVAGLMELQVKNTKEVMSLLDRGNLRRTCEPTAVNKTSSRSHAILKVTVQQQSCVLNVCQKVRTGVLFMVDLAGSERAANTQNRGLRMKEGGHINRSLLALANCINTLCSGAQYVNYRDSKLTRLLKDALSGNCHTVMIAHISPASICFEESKNTLKYADRAKHLKTKLSSNILEVEHHVSEYNVIMKSLEGRVKELERQKRRGWREGPGEGGSLCAKLKTLLQEEKDIRQEMVSLEYQLLLNAVESQKHLATIRLSEITLSQSPLPPTSPFPPSPLPPTSPSLHSPVPTSLEDIGQSSLLFERSPNHIVVLSHMTQPTDRSTDLVGTATSQEISATHDSHVTTAEMSHDSHMTAEQLTSPDSGFPSSGEGVQRGVVDLARSELAVLVVGKQRTEGRHRGLGRRLMEIRASKTQLLERMSRSRLRPLQSELCAALQLCSDMEEEARQRELAAARASLQLGRRESALECLLELSGQLVAALQQYRALLEERAESLPLDLPPLLPLITRHDRLSRKIGWERRLPVAGRGLQLPTFSRFSARLCATATTTMAGSKSNLLVEDVTTDGEEEEEEEEERPAAISPVDISDVHLPSLSISPMPPDSSRYQPLLSFPSLPPLPHTTSLITPSTFTAHTGTSHSAIFPNSSLPAILPLPNTKPDDGSPHNPPNKPSNHSKKSPPSQTDRSSSDSTRVETRLQSSKRTSARGILAKVGFSAPRITVSRSSSNKSKYVVNPALIEQLERLDLINSDLLTPVTSPAAPDLSTRHTLPDLYVPSNHTSEDLGVSTRPRRRRLPTKPFSSLPTVGSMETQPGGKGRGAGREMRMEELESFSQVSLNRKPLVGGKKDGMKRFPRPKAQSSIAVVKATTEQRGKREPLPARAIRKPLHSVTVLPRKKANTRQPLPMARVVAGSHVDATLSPYLTSTTRHKAGAKRAAPKKVQSSHPAPKYGKSPYHISMARTTKTKK